VKGKKIASLREGKEARKARTTAFSRAIKGKKGHPPQWERASREKKKKGKKESILRKSAEEKKRAQGRSRRWERNRRRPYLAGGRKGEKKRELRPCIGEGDKTSLNLRHLQKKGKTAPSGIERAGKGDDFFTGGGKKEVGGHPWEEPFFLLKGKGNQTQPTVRFSENLTGGGKRAQRKGPFFFREGKGIPTVCIGKGKQKREVASNSSGEKGFVKMHFLKEKQWTITGKEETAVLRKVELERTRCLLLPKHKRAFTFKGINHGRQISRSPRRRRGGGTPIAFENEKGGGGDAAGMVVEGGEKGEGAFCLGMQTRGGIMGEERGSSFEGGGKKASASPNRK